MGRLLKPCGLEWLPDGQNHYMDPLIRLNRLAYREFSRNPDLDADTFKQLARRELFGVSARPETIEDLFYLVDVVLADRQGSYFCASPILIPERLFAKAKAANWPQTSIADYRARVEQLRELARRHTGAKDPVEQQIQSIAAWVVTQWDAYQN